MYYGLLALLTRSMRQDARQLRNHIFRLVFVAFIYLSLMWATVTAGSFGAPGLRFFQVIAWLNALFITCAGIGFFASAITEEKEEETIGLLIMAGLNPLGILLGKSTSRLIQASLLLVVQFPFMLLAVTLGGITPHQILATYVALLAFMTFLANLALVWSTVCERSGSAAGMTTLLLVGYAGAPFTAPLVKGELARQGWTTSSTFGYLAFQSLDWLTESSVYSRLFSHLMATGFQEAIISHQVISNVVAGIVCFGIAWSLFTPCTKNSSAGAVSRGLVLRSSSGFRLLSPGRPWPMPLAWKDFQFIAGGYAFCIIKLLAYTGLAMVLVYLYNIGFLGGWYVVEEMYLAWLSFAIVVESSILAARIFHDEVRLQTLSSLLMLPRSIPYLAYSKALGCLFGLLPSVAGLVIGMLLLHDVDVPRAMSVMLDPVVWGAILILMIFLHLVALLSLFVKWVRIAAGDCDHRPVYHLLPCLHVTGTGGWPQYRWQRPRFGGGSRSHRDRLDPDGTVLFRLSDDDCRAPAGDWFQIMWKGSHDVASVLFVPARHLCAVLSVAANRFPVDPHPRPLVPVDGGDLRRPVGRPGNGPELWRAGIAFLSRDHVPRRGVYHPPGPELLFKCHLGRERGRHAGFDDNGRNQSAGTALGKIDQPAVSGCAAAGDSVPVHVAGGDDGRAAADSDLFRLRVPGGLHRLAGQCRIALFGGLPDQSECIGSDDAVADRLSARTFIRLGDTCI